MTALHELSATQLLDAYRRKRLSPVEVIQQVLDQAERWEPHIHATYLLRPDRALAQARQSEARWMQGKPCGLLDGVPVTIKDNLATLGDPLPLGTAASDMTPAQADAPPSARLREAGAIAWSKTTMPDYGMLSSGLSSFHATARNPWDVSKGPGGSSAGAGAAAAAGYGPLHIGTDIGGSIRLPASWCGIAGFKPSLGRVPIDPPYTGRCAGPMARTVNDLALSMLVLARPDIRDAMSLPFEAIPWEKTDVKPWRLRGLRIGLMLDAGSGLEVDPEVKAAVEQAARLMALQGAQIETVAPLLSREALDGMDRFWRMRSLMDMRRLPAERLAKVLPFIRDWAEGAADLDAATLFEAQHQFYALRQSTVRACAAYDYVISPTTPITAFNADLASPTDDSQRPLEHIAFTVPFNMSEQPALSVNCGYSRDGLPIGLQIVGQRFDDLGVLQVGRAFEQIREAQRPWPQVPGGEAVADPV